MSLTRGGGGDLMGTELSYVLKPNESILTSRASYDLVQIGVRVNMHFVQGKMETGLRF